MQAHSNAPRSVVRPSQHAGGRRRRDTPGPAARGRGLTTRTCMRDPNGLAVAGGPGAARRHGRPAGHWNLWPALRLRTQRPFSIAGVFRSCKIL